MIPSHKSHNCYIFSCTDSMVILVTNSDKMIPTYKSHNCYDIFSCTDSMVILVTNGDKMIPTHWVIWIRSIERGIKCFDSTTNICCLKSKCSGPESYTSENHSYIFKTVKVSLLPDAKETPFINNTDGESTFWSLLTERITSCQRLALNLPCVTSCHVVRLS